MYDATIKDRVRKEVKAQRKELQDHRRRRLMRVIVERYGGFQAALARAAGVSIKGLNMALGASITFGDYRARNIEQAIGLPWGWLDTDDPHLPRNLSPDPKPVGKHTGMPSRLTAKLYPEKRHKPRRLERVAA